MRVQTFVTVVPVGLRDGMDSYVITNEVTGRHFSANKPSVAFLEALKRHRDPIRSAVEAGLTPQEGARLLESYLQHGLVVDPGKTRASGSAAKGPIEGRLVSIRQDLFDIGPLTRSLGWLGRWLYSWPAALVWAILVLLALSDLMRSADRLGLAMRGLVDLQFAYVFGFASVFVITKIVHELGHALAYRQMCRREGLEPGPVRVGLMVFAGTPFPYTDVSGAWRIRSRWRRAMIGAGGVYAETWLLAIFVIFWANTRAAPLSDVILQVAVVSGGLAILFNLNPAVKLDGYYVLSDLIGRPNMVGRASSAARTVLARWLGAELTWPEWSDLLYWSVSYLYRLSIFLGIFWIAWRIDPRLGPIVAFISLTLLVVRPMVSSIKFSMDKGARRWRIVGLSGLGIAALVTMFIPFPARMLAEGNYYRYETRFVSPPETGIVRRVANTPGLVIESEYLDWRLTDARLRLEGLEAIARSVPASALQASRTESDLASLKRLAIEAQGTVERQVIKPPTGAVWTDLAVKRAVDTTVPTDFEEPLAAISTPVPPFLSIKVLQEQLDPEADLSVGSDLIARFKADPDCQLAAEVSLQAQAVRDTGGVIVLRATPDGPEVACAKDKASGASLVVRTKLPPRSMFRRLQLLASRLLQDRLPI